MKFDLDVYLRNVATIDEQPIVDYMKKEIDRLSPEQRLTLNHSRAEAIRSQAYKKHPEVTARLRATLQGNNVRFNS